MATNDMIKSTMNKMSDKKAPVTIKDYVKCYEKEIARALPSVLTPERFSRMVTTAITQTPKISDCTPQSFIGAMLTAAQLGLEPNTPLGQAYLIPYGNTCQFQIGYKGLIDLANRSGEVKNIEAHIVYEGDEFEFEYGLENKLKHKPSMNKKGEPQWVYAIYKLVNGGYGFEVMGYDEVLAHGRKYSKTFNNGPWKTEPEEMAKKTMLKKVLKYAPLKSDFIKDVITEDNSVKFFDKNDSEIKFVPEDTIEVDYSVSDEIRSTSVDAATGEIING